MLRYTKQANEDLASILVDTIDTLVYHRTNTFGNLASYGQYVYTYRRNRTDWYAFYDRCEQGFIVNRITNNWNVLLPRL